MKVLINNREIKVADDTTTLAQLLAKENLDGAGKAVAVGNRIAARATWSGLLLEEGMNITVISAVCGG